MNDVANFDEHKSKIRVSVHVLFRPTLWHCFSSARALVQQKRMIQTRSLDFILFYLPPFSSISFFKSETAKSHLLLCFASSWGGVVWCPTSFCSFFFSFNTLYPQSPFSFSLRPLDCHFFLFFKLIYKASSIACGSLFRFTCCRKL